MVCVTSDDLPMALDRRSEVCLAADADISRRLLDALIVEALAPTPVAAE